MTNALRASGDVTATKSFLTPHPSGLFALCAPENPAEADEIEPKELADLLRLLQGEFDWVIVDTSAGISEANLVAVEASTDLMVVATTDLAAIQAMRKVVVVLDQIGLNSHDRFYVLNRANAKVGVGQADIERSTGLTIDVTVPSSRAVPVAMNQGLPVLEDDPRSPASRSVLDLLQEISPARSRARWVKQELAAKDPIMSLSDRMKAAGASTDAPIADLAPPDEAAPEPELTAQNARDRAVARLSPTRPGDGPGKKADPLRDLKLRAQQALFARLGSRLYDTSLEQSQIQSYVREELAEIVDSERLALSAAEREGLVEQIAATCSGTARWTPSWKTTPSQKSWSSARAQIYVEREGLIVETDDAFVSTEHLRRVIERIVSRIGRRIDEASPMVDARLPDGSRVNAIIPPLAVDGPASPSASSPHSRSQSRT